MVAFTAKYLSELAEIYELSDNLEAAQEIVNEALEAGKIVTAGGTVKKEIVGYRDLNLAATGASQYYDDKSKTAVIFGDDEDDDLEIHAALWVIFKNTPVPPEVKQQRMKASSNPAPAKASRRFTVDAGRSREETIQLATDAAIIWWEANSEAERTARRAAMMALVAEMEAAGESAEDLEAIISTARQTGSDDGEVQVIGIPSSGEAEGDPDASMVEQEMAQEAVEESPVAVEESAPPPAKGKK